MTAGVGGAEMFVQSLPLIQSRIDAATIGPWQAIAGGVVAPVGLGAPHSDLGNVRSYGGRLIAESISRSADSQFIANARTDMPLLVAAVEWLSQAVAEQEQLMDTVLAAMSDEQFATISKHVPLDANLRRRARREGTA